MFWLGVPGAECQRRVDREVARDGLDRRAVEAGQPEGGLEGRAGGAALRRLEGRDRRRLRQVELAPVSDVEGFGAVPSVETGPLLGPTTREPAGDGAVRGVVLELGLGAGEAQADRSMIASRPTAPRRRRPWLEARWARALGWTIRAIWEPPSGPAVSKTPM